MQFNSKKCYVISITRQLRSKSDNSYHLGADMLARVDSYPYLSVTISSDLKWHNHISHITAKASRTLDFVYGVMSTIANLKSNHLLTHPLSLRPQREYASAAWDPYLVGDIQQLGKVQRRAARFVFRDYKYTTCVTGLLERLEWPLLSTRRTNSGLTLFYKAVHDQAGISLHHLQKPLLNTRSADDTTFIALSARKDPYLFSFSLGLLPIGTNCHANSALNHQSTLSVSLCTVHQLFNRHSQPRHSSGNGLMRPIAGYLPKNRRISGQTFPPLFLYLFIVFLRHGPVLLLCKCKHLRSNF